MGKQKAMENDTGPAYIYKPDESSNAEVDKLHIAIIKGKLKTTRKLINGGGNIS